MKSTGIVRKLDELGRIVIPKELRNKLKLEERDPMEIFIEGESIILKKFEPGCIICNNSKDLTFYKDKLICTTCINALYNINNEKL